MEELYMNIIRILTVYGWQLTACALSGIFLLGILKHFKVFDKITVKTKIANENGELVKLTNEKLTKQVKKLIYIAISMTLSIGASALYLYFYSTFTATALFTVSGAVLSLTLTAYALYENFGVRYALEKFGNYIKANWLNTIAKIKIAKEANKAEKEKAKAELIESGKTALDNALSTVANNFGVTADDIRKAVEMVQTLKK